MLDRKLAEPLLIYVNDPHFMSAFKDALQAKITLLQRDLASASDLLTIGRLQGGIKELNRLLLIDQEVKGASK